MGDLGEFQHSQGIIEVPITDFDQLPSLGLLLKLFVGGPVQGFAPNICKLPIPKP